MKGSVRQRGSTFTAYWKTKDLSTGHYKQHSRGGFSGVRAAQRFLSTQLADIERGTFIAVDLKATVEQLFRDHWLPIIRSGAKKGSSSERRRPNTIAGYELISEKWVLPHLGGATLASLTPRDVDTWLTDLQEHGGHGGRPLGARSAQAALRCLKSALTYGVDAGLIKANVAARATTPGGTRREMASWTLPEARTFLEVIKGDRLEACWALFLLRGPRRGEVAGLRWENVDLASREIHIRTTRVVIGGTSEVVDSLPKSARGIRSLPLDDTLVDLFKKHKAKQNEERLSWGAGYTDLGFVFAREDGLPFSPPSISQRFERLCAANALRKIRLHDLRHSCATLAQASGMSIERLSRMLGHSSVSITLDVYTHSSSDDIAESAATFTESLVGT